MGIAGALTDRAARLLYRTLEVSRADEVAPHFHLLELGGDDFLGVTSKVGDKVQLRMSGLTNRTYTPMGVDAEAGSTRLLAYVHGDGPGASWASTVAVGDSVQVFGPRGSLDLSALEQAPVLVGDETSFGLAGALAAEGRHVPVAQLYEVADPAGAATALAAVDGAPADLVPRDDGRDVLADRLVELVRSHPDAPLVLTGCAQTIRHLRGRIKDEGLRPSAKVKAYWDENRSGLD